MDGGDTFVGAFLQNANVAREAIFSENTVALLNQHVLSPSSPLQTLRRQFIDLLSTAFAMVTPVLQPLLDRLNTALTNSPDVVVLLFAVVLLFLALQVLAWMRRMVAWVTGLMFRLMFWACVLAMVAVVVQRGPEQTVRDGVVVVSKVMGYGAALRDVWVSEYRRYEAQQSEGPGARAAHEYVQAGARGGR
ncbi:hypothetical protein VMCG_10097 [Cytospora schulzeri]|uniref:Uncharacterized protein n=1 Tax=Cytospora schulzeri TaxID=448051 RepID=A0A423VGA6_9PEZI|nr:hypothetical protein VMCG_10097 [Valsa malicola]